MLRACIPILLKEKFEFTWPAFFVTCLPRAYCDSMLQNDTTAKFYMFIQT